MESKLVRKLATTVAATDHRALRKAGTDQVRQLLSASTAVQTYEVSDARVAQWLFALCREKPLSPLFLNKSTFLQSFLNNKKVASNISLLQSFQTATKALPFFTVPVTRNTVCGTAVFMGDCTGERAVGVRWLLSSGQERGVFCRGLLS